MNYFYKIIKNHGISKHRFNYNIHIEFRYYCRICTVLIIKVYALVFYKNELINVV